MRHNVCSNCGKYKGRKVVDLEVKALKKQKKSEKKA
jgi:uncharacterized protein (DUF3820 family)